MVTHEWIKRYATQDNKVNPNDKVNILQNVKQFAKGETFHKTIISLMVGLLVDSNQLDRIKNVFMEVDYDNNGYLDKEEFKEACTKCSDLLQGDQTYEELFDELDLNGDGKIDYEEFITATFDH